MIVLFKMSSGKMFAQHLHRFYTLLYFKKYVYFVRDALANGLLIAEL